MNLLSSMLMGVMSLDWLLSDTMFGLPAALVQTNVLTRLGGNIVLILEVAAGLGFVIFVHELGHFLAAKTFGVKCEKFYIGFDFPISLGPIKLPRKLGSFRWGETEYGIGILPLGGYVKMLGQDDDPRNAEAEAERIRQGEGPDAQLDPRSYQAKPVWQRMIIISAGVVMNVIFAVFLAGAAFWYGVPYTPTTIGSTPIGSPAWTAGMQPGDRILQVARMTQDDENLRYEEMAAKTAVHGMKNGAAPIPFTLDRDGQRITMAPTPAKDLHPKGFYMVGINQATVAVVGAEPAKHSYLSSRKVDIRKGDRIIAVDGQPLPIDKNSGKILSYNMTNLFQAKWNQPVEVTILRKVDNGDANAPAEKNDKMPTSTDDDKDTTPRTEVKVTLPPVPVKTLGLGFAIGKVTAIRSGSMAESAGIRVGDVIEKVDGAAIEDALQLPMLVAEKAGKPIVLTVRRTTNSKPKGDSPGSADSKPQGDSPGSPDTKPQGDSPGSVEPPDVGTELTFTLQTNDPPAFGSIGPISSQLSLENYGIAYSVSNVVSWIDPKATKAGSQVEVGDKLTQIAYEVSDDERKELAEDDLVLPPGPKEVSSMRSLPYYLSEFQHLPEGIKVRCYLERDGNTREVVLPIYYAEHWNWIQRGVPMTSLQRIQKTDNVVQALQWGVTETGRKLGDVFEFLTILVQGKADRNGLAGPVGILQAASQEASDGPSRLLLFLTLLSANLAILNFLPIPALDGGHMVFLTWEAIRGKPLDETMQGRLTIAGVLCLLSLMAFALFNDLTR